jgi:hypothetical protein
MDTQILIRKVNIRAIIFAIMIFIMTGITEAQKSADHRFKYRPDFIRQMVYLVSCEAISSSGSLTIDAQVEAKDPEIVLESWMTKGPSFEYLQGSATDTTVIGNQNSNSLEEFLIQASHLSESVGSKNGIEKVIEGPSQQNGLEEFLISASHLKRLVPDFNNEEYTIQNKTEDMRLEEFLLHASRLTEPVFNLEEESATNQIPIQVTIPDNFSWIDRCCAYKPANPILPGR